MYTYPICIATVMVTALALVGCERNAEPNKDSTTFPKSTFQSPSDGKLTEKQVADYIVIRQRIIRDVKANNLKKKDALAEGKVGSAMSSNIRYFDEIERAVSNSFNMSYDEFLWIKDTVIFTQTTLLVQHYYELNNRIMTLLDQTLLRYKEISTVTHDPQERLKMDGYVEEMRREMSNLRGKITDPNERPEPLAHNSVIITKFINELETLEQQALK